MVNRTADIGPPSVEGLATDHGDSVLSSCGARDAIAAGAAIAEDQGERMTTHTARCCALVALTTLFAALLVGVGAAPAAHAAPTPKTWTIMVYVDGDNNLESMIPHDFIKEFCNPGSNAEVNVVCIVDRSPRFDKSYGNWSGAKLFYCTAGEKPTAADAVADWGNTDMGDPQTLIDFMDWAKTDYPASHYAICFWDHGFLWYPEYYNMRDGTSKDALSEDEFMTAMTAAGPVDVVAWDCCTRQTVEIGTVFRPFAQAMVGSEEETNWVGLQYNRFIANLEKYPAWNAEQLADDMAATAMGDSACYSEVNLDARWDDLITAVDQWSVALVNGLPKYRARYDMARAHTQAIWGHYAWDLYDAARTMKKDVPDPAIRSTSQAVMDAVIADVGYNWVRPTPMWGMTWGRCHGLTIWWPKYKDQLNPSWTKPYSSINDWTYYQTKIPFGTETHWAEFLAGYTRNR